MLPRPGAADQEVVRTFDRGLVAVARDVPHYDLVTLPDLPAAEFDLLERGTAHMRQGSLPADDFGHETVDQRRIVAEFLVLVRIPVEGKDAARHGVARGVVAADDQQDQIAEE